MEPAVYRCGWRHFWSIVYYPEDDTAPEFDRTEDVLVGGFRLRVRLHFLAAFLINKCDGDKTGLGGK